MLANPKAPLRSAGVVFLLSCGRFAASSTPYCRGSSRRLSSPSVEVRNANSKESLCRRDVHERVVDLCRSRGFVFSGSEIYGGLNCSFDYGPLGTTLKNNLRQAWWNSFVQSRPDCVGLDSAILMNPQVWKATGHVDQFSDPLIECKKCHNRFRVDHLLEDNGCEPQTQTLNPQQVLDVYEQEIVAREVKCPTCKEFEWSRPRNFNMLFSTSMSTINNAADQVFLRPETAQGVFINFPKVVRSTRRRLPLGIGQVGKSFRNEISTGPFMFRTKEFEQMELQYFCEPSEAAKWHQYWLKYCYDWLVDHGISSIRVREYSNDDLAHYAQACSDIEFEYGFGWSELWGVANRGDFDLRAHERASGEDLRFENKGGQPFHPYVIEPALGLDRAFLAALTDAYQEDTVDGRKRVSLRLHSDLAPFQFSVLPLVKNNNDIVALAESIFSKMSKSLRVDFDMSGSIGRRYRRQDECGTPVCITVDYDSLEDHRVTVRDRDTTRQQRIHIDDLLQRALPKRQQEFFPSDKV